MIILHVVYNIYYHDNNIIDTNNAPLSPDDVKGAATAVFTGVLSFQIVVTIFFFKNHYKCQKNKAKSSCLSFVDIT